MDKKNTMLLTVIAVATLLVAVVGATFAYFSITTSAGGSSQANFSGQTEEISSYGTLVLSDGAAKNLYMYVTAADMAQSNIGKAFHAVTTVNGTTSNFAETEQSHPIAVMTRSKVGTEAVKGNVQCEAKLLVKSTGGLNADETAHVFTEATDGTLTLKNGSNATGFTATPTPTTLTLKEIFDATNTGAKEGKEVTVTFNLNGEGTSTLYADVVLNNTASEQQRIAGKAFGITIESQSVTCDVLAD